MASHEDDVDGRGVVGSLGGCGGQLCRRRVGPSGGEIGCSKLAQHRRDVGRCGGLGDRSPKVGGSDICGSLLDGAPSARPQMPDDGCVAGRIRLEQMGGHGVRIGACGGEDPRRSRMSLGAGSYRHVEVDRGPDQRMGERQSSLVAQHLHAHERLH